MQVERCLFISDLQYLQMSSLASENYLVKAKVGEDKSHLQNLKYTERIQRSKQIKGLWEGGKQKPTFRQKFTEGRKTSNEEAK